MDWQTEAAGKAAILEVLAELGLTVESVFVPFSQSRNAKEKGPDGKPWKSLNWKVTVKRNGRDVLTTDYSAGVAHCPSYAAKVPGAWDRPARMWQGMVCDFEMESGFKTLPWTTWGGFRPDRKKPILPDPADVLHSLTMDADVLNAGGFEDWATDLGYDTDSRKAESIYRACLDLALKMRAAVGEDGLAKLQSAFQDY